VSHAYVCIHTHTHTHTMSIPPVESLNGLRMGSEEEEDADAGEENAFHLAGGSVIARLCLACSAALLFERDREREADVGACVRKRVCAFRPFRWANRLPPSLPPFPFLPSFRPPFFPPFLPSSLLPFPEARLECPCLSAPFARLSHPIDFACSIFFSCITSSRTSSNLEADFMPKGLSPPVFCGFSSSCTIDRKTPENRTIDSYVLLHPAAT
jgi:hypothetical protein